MDVEEIKTKLYEIKNNNSLSELDDLIDTAEKDKEFGDKLLTILDSRPGLLYFLLINASKKSNFLKNVRSLFESTTWFKKIMKNLYHPDLSIRKYFLREIGAAKSEIFLRILIDKLKDFDWTIRKDILYIISKYHSGKSTNIMVSMLDDKDNRIVKEVAIKLAEKGKEILPLLDAFLKLPTTKIKVNLTEILSKIDSVETIPYLLRLATDSNEEVRLHAQKSFFTLLEKKPFDDYPMEKEKIFQFFKSSIENADPRALPMLIKTLLQFQFQGTPIIVANMEVQIASRGEYFNVIKEIKTFDKLYLYMEMSISKDADIRTLGIEYLSRYEFQEKDQEYIIDILETFIHLNVSKFLPETRSIFSSFILQNKLLEVFVKELRSDDSFDREKAVRTVGLINDPKISLVLTSIISDPSKDVRVAIVETLGDLNDETLFPFFEKMLSDPDDSVQIKAIKAMSKLKNVKIKDIMFRLIDHPNKNIREIATEAIAKESLKKYIDSFDKFDNSSKVKITKLLEKLDKETELILAKDIKSIDPEIRKRVINILKNINDKSKFKSIIKVALRDPDTSIRSMVVALITHLEDRDILIELVKLLSDPDQRVRANTIEALGNFEKLNPNIAYKALGAFLNDANNRIRANAVIALYNLGYHDVKTVAFEMLQHPSDLMRTSGVFIIGYLNLSTDYEKLLPLFQDSSILVRKNLIKTFFKIGRKEYLNNFLNDPNEEVRKLAKEYFEKRQG